MISWMKNAACDGRASERSLMLLVGSSKIACRDENKVDEIVDYPMKKGGELNKNYPVVIECNLLTIKNVWRMVKVASLENSDG